jgi:hypothetical protein
MITIKLKLKVVKIHNLEGCVKDKLIMTELNLKLIFI